MPLLDGGHGMSFAPDSSTLFGRQVIQDMHDLHKHTIKDIRKTPSRYLDNKPARMCTEYAEYRAKADVWKPDQYQAGVLKVNELAHNLLLSRSAPCIDAELSHEMLGARERMRSKGIGPTASRVASIPPPFHCACHPGRDAGAC
jgi:hypothetical protein